MYAEIKICFLYLFQQCLKTQQIIFLYMILQKLSRDCNDVIRNVIKDSAHNYMEDPVLASTCEKEVLVYSSSIVLNLLSFILETWDHQVHSLTFWIIHLSKDYAQYGQISAPDFNQYLDSII